MKTVITHTTLMHTIKSIMLLFLLPSALLSNTDIIGNVWIDNDFNNTYNGELGPTGLTVQLMDSESLMVISSVTTMNGKFEFSGIGPGNYLLSIPGSAFGTGSTLNGLMSCVGTTPADDMIDDNDNGSDSDPLDIRTTSFKLTDNDPVNNVLVDYIDFCFTQGTCDEPNPFASVSCADVLGSDIVCEMSTLSSFCYTMPTGTSGGVQPSPLCTGDDEEATNISWIGFVAAGGDYNMTITPIDCQNNGIGNFGFQVGIYQDCTFEESIACSSGCSLSAFTVSSDVLVEGETYYLFINGCSGSVCSYAIDVAGSFTSPDLTPQKVCVNNNGQLQCDSTEYCIGGSAYIQAMGLGIVADYEWSISNLSGAPFSGNSSPTTDNSELEVNFNIAGRYEVCLNNVSNGCQNWSGSVCTTVKVTPSIPFVGDEEFADQFVCVGNEDMYDINMLNNQDPNNDGTSGWQGPTDNITLGLNTAVILQPGCAYKQSFELDIYDEAPVSNVFLAVCGNDLPLVLEGMTIDQSSFGDEDIINIDGVLALSPNQDGCDSIINFAIEKLDIVDGVMNTPQCTFNSVILDFDYDVDASTSFLFLSYVWKDPNGNIIFDPQQNNDPTDIEVLMGSPAGTYTLTVTITKSGFLCEYIYPVEVDFTNIQPPSPTVSGLTIVCSGADSEATYTASGGDPEFNIIWTVPSDADIISTSGVFGNMITVSWDGSAGGTVTAQSENQCGFSELGTLDVTVIPANIADFDLDTEVCIDGEISVSSSGSDINVISYLWDFGGAQVVDGSIFSIGPNVLSWNTTGTKSVSLQTTNTNGCISQPTTKSIEVIDQLPPVVVQCSPEIDNILFMWQPTPNTSYSVDVKSAQDGNFEGDGLYRVTNLNPGEIVTIEVSQTQDDGVCSEPVTTLISCVAQDCPTIAISLSAAQTTFCATDTDGTTINAIVTGATNGTGTYAGPGITDSEEGTFDPTAAIIGTNVITYSYSTDEGCFGSQTIELNVNEAPSSSFTVSDNVICKGSELQITYTGTPGVEVLNWQASVFIAGIANPSVIFDDVGAQIITLTVTKDGCVSEVTSVEVEVVDAPSAIFDVAADEICITDDLQLTYTGGSVVDNYAWNTGIGSVDNVPNPLVSFIFPGEKTIELIVSNGDCISEVYTRNITVDAVLSDIVVSCNPSEGLIDFSWNDIEGASSYLVTVDGNSPFTTTDNSFTVNNLNSGEIVDVSIEAVSDGACPNVSTSLSCTALVSSVDEAPLEGLILYPNPVLGILYIDNLPTHAEYEIIDILGQKTMSGKYINGVDVSQLTDGVYFIKMVDGTSAKSAMLKFLKE